MGFGSLCTLSILTVIILDFLTFLSYENAAPVSRTMLYCAVSDVSPICLYYYGIFVWIYTKIGHRHVSPQSRRRC